MHSIRTTIGEVITDTLPVVSEDDTIATAIDVMLKTPSEGVVVLRDGRVRGIFTERDLLTRVAGKGLNPTEVVVSQVMTSTPITLGAKDSIAYAINTMAVGGFSNIPILDNRHKPIGLLGVRNVVQHLSKVFAELAGPTTQETDLPGWIDIGGG
jgi:CBS domain-containing protein